MEPHHEKGVEGHQCYFFLTDVLSQVHFFFWEEICLRKLKVHKTCTGILKLFCFKQNFVLRDFFYQRVLLDLSNPLHFVFFQPDISDEEPPPPKMARGRRRARFKAEPTRAQAVTSSQRKGKGRGAKIAKSTRTSQAETCPDIPDQELSLIHI